MTTQDKLCSDRSVHSIDAGRVSSRANRPVIRQIDRFTIGEVFYFGTSPDESLCDMFAEAKCGLVRSEFKPGLLSTETGCVAVVLQWKSNKDQQVIEEAKAIGLPIVVITSQLAAAFQAGEPRADLYLEEPASNEEVATLLIEMITVMRQNRKTFACSAGH